CPVVRSRAKAFHIISILVLPGDCPSFLWRLYSLARIGIVELYQFDEEDFQRLRRGDATTESHFVTYFAKLLRIKLRARYLPPDTVEDLQQETFVRVFRALRTGPDLRKPDRIGAYVNSVCNNVLQEHYRASNRQRPLEDDHLEIPDKSLNLEGLLISK